MPTKSLPRMAAPLVISFTLRFLFTFVDFAYAALQRDDNASVAAIGLYAPLQSVYVALWVGLSAGFTASLANAFGHRDAERVALLERSMLRILCVLSPALALLIGGGVWLVVPQLGLDPALERAFLIYATTLAVGLPLTGFWSVYPDSIVKAHQDTRATMIAGLATACANVALSTLFVFAFDWGIFGIALATVLSRLSGLGYAMRRARALEQQRESEAWERTDRVWPDPVPAIVYLAIPGTATWLLQAAESAVINRLLLGLPDATTAIAAFAVYHQLLTLALMPAAGTAVAVVPYVARLLPLGDLGRVARELRTTTLAALALALAATLCMGWLFAEPLAAFFVQRSAAAAGDTLPPSALDALRLLPLGALAAAPFFVLRPVFEAAHRPRIGIEVSCARFVLLSLPSLLLGRFLGPVVGLDGLRGMILGVCLANALATLWARHRARQVLADVARAPVVRDRALSPR